MRSMTGFGQGAAEGERFRVAVTLKAVNHRYLDLVLRLKDEVRAAERDIRNRLTEDLFRGRVEAVFELETLAGGVQEVEIDRELAVSLRKTLNRFAEERLISPQLTFGDLLRIPEAVRLRASKQPWEEDDLALLTTAAERALDQLVEARKTEGEKLAEVLLERIASLRALHGEMTQMAEKLPAQWARTLRERIDELLDDGAVPDETRLAQEVALTVDRTDISEELDRLGSHLEHFLEIAAQEESIGKRLDFLSQEIFRELNTIGSKCRDADLVRRVLDAKVLCEQIREQVQNVE